MERRELTSEEKQWAANLKQQWLRLKGPLGLNQEVAADRLGYRSQSAVSQFLNAQVPLSTNAKLGFARLLRIPVSMIDPALIEGAPPFNGDNVREISSGHSVRSGPVWHISWVVAGDWCEAEDPFQPGDGFEQIHCPEPHSPRTIALTVDGPSMDDGTEDGYKDGEIIFVDGDAEAKHNSDVVVRTPEGKATFKRLQITSEGTYLLALNPDWPNRIIQIPEGTAICGVVIGSYKRRRK